MVYYTNINPRSFELHLFIVPHLDTTVKVCFKLTLLSDMVLAQSYFRKLRNNAKILKKEIVYHLILMRKLLSFIYQSVLSQDGH